MTGTTQFWSRSTRIRWIKSAFHAGWHEFNNAVALPNPLEMRNRLAGTIAILAQKGITDPLELKDLALQRVTRLARLH